MVVSRGVQEKNKDQQVATIVQDRTMKLEEGVKVVYIPLSHLTSKGREGV